MNNFSYSFPCPYSNDFPYFPNVTTGGINDTLPCDDGDSPKEELEETHDKPGLNETDAIAGETEKEVEAEATVAVGTEEGEETPEAKETEEPDQNEEETIDANTTEEVEEPAVETEVVDEAQAVEGPQEEAEANNEGEENLDETIAYDSTTEQAKEVDVSENVEEVADNKEVEETTVEEPTMEQAPPTPQDEQTPPITKSGPPTFFSCIAETSDDLDASLDTTNVDKITIAFDYDIYTPQSADVTTSVEWFQSDLLEHVASEYGLTTCETVRRKGRRTIGSIGGGGRGGLRHNHHQRGLKKDSGGGLLLGVSSDPEDEEDDVYVECISELPNFDEPSICTPFNGYLTAWIPIDESNKNARHRRLLSNSESEILTTIENYIATKEEYDSPDDVLAVSYIGNRADVVKSQGSGTTTSGFMAGELGSEAVNDNDQKSGLAPGYIVLIVAMSFLILLAITGMYLKWSKARKKARSSEGEGEGEEAEEEEVSSQVKVEEEKVGWIERIKHEKMKLFEKKKKNSKSVPAEESSSTTDNDDDELLKEENSSTPPPLLAGIPENIEYKPSMKSIKSFDTEDGTTEDESLAPCQTFDSEGGLSRESVLHSVALSHTRSDARSSARSAQSARSARSKARSDAGSNAGSNARSEGGNSDVRSEDAPSVARSDTALNDAGSEDGEEESIHSDIEVQLQT